jgi:hypothetical protein
MVRKRSRLSGLRAAHELERRSPNDRSPSGYAQVVQEFQGTTLTRVYNYGLDLIRRSFSGALLFAVFD